MNISSCIVSNKYFYIPE